MVLTTLDRNLYQEEIDNIKMELGAPLLFNELTDEQILYNLLKAFATLNAYRGVTLPSLYIVEYERGGVVLPFVVSNSIIDIYRLKPASEGPVALLLSQLTGGLAYYFNLQLMSRIFQSGSGVADLENLAIAGRYLGVLKEIFGPQTEVFYNVLNQKLVIANAGDGERFAIIFNDFLNAKYLKNYFLYDYFWVINYAKALCKIMLGEIRTKVKFSAVFGDASFQIKDAEMLSEGMAEEEKLRNELLERRSPYHFLTEFLE